MAAGGKLCTFTYVKIGKLLNVRSGHKSLFATSGDDYCAHFFIGINFRKRLVKLLDGLLIQSIHLLGAVDGNYGVLLLVVNYCVFESHGLIYFSSNCICTVLVIFKFPGATDGPPDASEDKAILYSIMG